jgi:hypothetical protein
MIEIDERDQQYAIDVITGRSASYDLTFSDERTTRAELDQYLSCSRPTSGSTSREVPGPRSRPLWSPWDGS